MKSFPFSVPIVIGIKSESFFVLEEILKRTF